LSGLNQIRNGFQNLLENGFEKLEKEKKREISFIRNSARFFRSPAHVARRLSLSARGPPSPLLRSAPALGPSRGRRPS
jgi:hypothetical protein